MILGSLTGFFFVSYSSFRSTSNHWKSTRKFEKSREQVRGLNTRTSYLETHASSRWATVTPKKIYYAKVILDSRHYAQKRIYLASRHQAFVWHLKSLLLFRVPLLGYNFTFLRYLIPTVPRLQLANRWNFSLYVQKGKNIIWHWYVCVWRRYFTPYTKTFDRVVTFSRSYICIYTLVFSIHRHATTSRVAGLFSPSVYLERRRGSRIIAIWLAGKAGIDSFSNFN